MTTEEHRPPCWFCRADRGEDAYPGGWVHDDRTWRAGHVLEGWGPDGTVVLEARRHILDATEMNDEERRTFADVLGVLTAAIKQTSGADRVYLWSTCDAYPHFHVWLIPWREGDPRHGPAHLSHLASDQPCDQESAERTATELRAVLAA